MAVPHFQTLMRPLLEVAAAATGEITAEEARAKLAEQFHLTAADLAEKLGGPHTRFVNHVAWARVNLFRARLITGGQGQRRFAITPQGRAYLRDHQGEITVSTLQRFTAYGDSGLGQPDVNDDSAANSHLTPEDRIEAATAEIESALKAELIERLHAESPAFFERFIRDLMLAMSYGGGIRDRGFLTGRTGDGGIDGLIHEDALGLDAVYLQAKRYKPGSNVSAEQIRGFVGAMTGENASKGVFVTTSAFTRDAIGFVERVTQRIVLIDGDRLADLALRHGVGVRTQRTIAIQRIDEDYFAGED